MNLMNIQKHLNLADCTSFGTGGPSEVFVAAESVEDVLETLKTQPRPFWLLGRGANTLISDHGLPGTTIQLTLNSHRFNSHHVVAESGMGWDSLVSASLDEGLWGLELTSGIPGTVGAAVVGNIAAYGQAVSDTLEWVEIVDYSKTDLEIERVPASDLGLSYRNSKLNGSDYNTVIILRASFRLSAQKTTDLKYESAIKVAKETGLDVDDLHHRRKIILEARRRAGSLLDPKHQQKTAGSFFKNPLVSPDLAEMVMKFEERNVTRDAIRRQNIIHGGDAQRVSAAHVILAAGFKRGQTWGPVRIHPEHALKIENTGGATSKQIYDVAQEIISTVKIKLGIQLEPEVRFMGEF